MKTLIFTGLTLVMSSVAMGETCEYKYDTSARKYRYICWDDGDENDAGGGCIEVYDYDLRKYVIVCD